MEAARAATVADLADVVRLARDLRDELAAMRGGALWRAREAPPEPDDARYADLSRAGDARLVVGTVDGTVVGFGSLEICPLRTGDRLGLITELYVEPAARSVGVGEAITTVLLAYADEHGCIGVDALALPGHRATKNFFETTGFTARALVMHRPSNTRSHA
ncbi:MAG: GNAT family N-acetyltransferase [Acidimicrobiia bacterium]